MRREFLFENGSYQLEKVYFTNGKPFYYSLKNSGGEFIGTLPHSQLPTHALITEVDIFNFILESRILIPLHERLVALNEARGEVLEELNREKANLAG